MAALVLVGRAPAVEVSGTFDTTAPTNATVSGWESGWNAPGITGWDYVGTVNEASGVYLGNGFVLTAGHVGGGTFLLDGVTYDFVSGSNQPVGTADLTLFQIKPVTGSLPSLPALTLAPALSTPTAFTSATNGSPVVMIGYGDIAQKTWGENHVTEINEVTTLAPFVSTDFYTLTGTFTLGSRTITNNAQLISGDSGGGDFIFNTATSKWELAGINEATLQNDAGDTVGSAMVQLGAYDGLIQTMIAADEIPEPPVWTLLGFSAVAFAGWSQWQRRVS